MPIDRRKLLLIAAGAALPTVAGPRLASAQRLSTSGLDAAQFGVRAGAPDDQSRALQRAIEQAATARTPLLLGPGTYLAADLKLPAAVQILGVRGATRLALARAGTLLSADHADGVALANLTLDGRKLASNRALLQVAASTSVRIRDCDLQQCGGNGITFEQSSGEISGNMIADVADTAIFSRDARGLTISNNTIRGSGNGGIRVWRSDKGDDGSLIVNNRIEDTAARSGGTGENGNAINVYRAGHVIVQGNRIRNAAFSAIRGNAASNLVIQGNSCSNLGEVAIYAEFDFEGAVIANNVVDGAAVGVSVTNFDKGGRLALIQGNIFRNLDLRSGPGTGTEERHGIGISVEADTSVSGNVIENAAKIGITLGWGAYLRDVSVNGNIVRASPYGIGVSVVKGAGNVSITDNLITGARRGGIVGLEWSKVVTGDLAKDGAGGYEHLSVSNNRVR